MSSPIARFEAFMERLLETSIARVLDSRLDESVIMRRLERAMESNQIKRDNKVLVPHNLPRGDGTNLQLNIRQKWLHVTCFREHVVSSYGFNVTSFS